jgi:hypothetical protein
VIPTLSLQEALVTMLRGNGALAAALPTWSDAGNTVYPFYQDLAPERAPLPYLVYTIVAAPTRNAYGQPPIATDPTVRFTAFNNDSVAVMTAMNAVCVALDNVTLTLPNGNTQLFTLRTGDPVPRLASRSTDGKAKEVWSASVVYQFSAQ